MGLQSRTRLSDWTDWLTDTKLKEASSNSVLAHLVLPWANWCFFLMEVIFLSYVRETMFWNLPFFKMVLPKTNFFLFSNLGLIMAQQASIPVNCFMAEGWHTSCHPMSKMHTVEEGFGETPSALRCLSYLINSFLTGIKSVQLSSVTQSCPTLCNPMNHGTLGLPGHHQLLEFTQTRVHRVSDAIQSSHPLSSLLLLPSIPPSLESY